MSERQQLLHALDVLEALYADVAAITARSDVERKRELVAKRRELSEHLGKLAKLAEGAFAARGDAELMLDYRSRLSKVRARMAMHQADWPAVLLGERPDAFRASARQMREANREFIQWMREAVSRL
jgi:hypothetical protein